MSKQRTKGNKQPASSGRAAELLSSSGSSAISSVGFIGFDAVSGSLDGAKTDATGELDPEFRTVMRKLLKKDTITKVKGLKELQELVENCRDGNILIPAFPCWCRMYNKLSLDGNFKVRCSSHFVSAAFCKTLGKKIEKHIKEIVPFWLIGQHDPYADVATTAKNLFEECFKEEKQKIAVLLCQETVLELCCDLLTGKSNLSAPQKITQPTEQDETAEMRENRLFCSSLLTLQTLFGFVEGNQLDSIGIKLEAALWNSSKFWKTFSKHKQVSVKSAFFSSLAIWVNYVPERLKVHLNVVSGSVLANMDEKNESVVKSVWDALLYCISQFDEEFWSHVNVDKAFVPKLLAIVRKAASIQVVGPCLLPVLNSLVKSLTEEPLKSFYERLLAAFQIGLTFLHSKQTPIEVEEKAFVDCFCDCIKLALCDSRLPSSYAQEICSQFVLPFSKQLLQKGSPHAIVCLAQLYNWLWKQKHQLFDGKLEESLSYTFVTSLAFQSGCSCVEIFIQTCCQDWQNRSISDNLLNDVMNSVIMTPSLDKHKFFASLLKSCPPILDLACNHEKVGNINGLLDHFTSLINRFNSSEEEKVLVSCWFTAAVALSDSEFVNALEAFSQNKSLEVRLVLLDTSARCLNEKIIKEWCQTESFAKLWLLSIEQILESKNSDLRFMDIVRSLAKGFITLDLLEKTLLTFESKLVSCDQNGQTSRSAVLILSQITHAMFEANSKLSLTKAGEEVAIQLWSILLSHGVQYNEFLTVKETILLVVSQHSNLEFLNRLLCLVKNEVEKDFSRQVNIMWLVDQAVSLLASMEMGFTSVGWLFPDCENDWYTNNCLQWSSLALMIGNLYPCSYEFNDLSLPQPDTLFNMAAYVSAIFMHKAIAITEKDWLSDVSVSNLKGIFAAAAVFDLSRYGFSDIFHSKSMENIHIIMSFIEWSRVNIKITVKRAFLTKITYNSTDDDLVVQWIIRHMVYCWNLRPADLLGCVVDGMDKIGFSVASGLRSEVVTQSCEDNFHDNPLKLWNTRWILAREDCYGCDNDIMSEWLTDGQNKMQDLLLFCCKMSPDTEWETIAFNVNLIRFLTKICQNMELLEAETRDFICCSLITWFQTCLECTSGHTYKEQLFCMSVLQLFDCCASSIGGFVNEPQMAGFLSEWNDFFVDGYSAVILPWYLRLSESLSDNNCDIFTRLLLNQLGQAVCFLNGDQLEKVQLPAMFDPELDHKQYPPHLQSLILSVNKGILSQIGAIQVTSYTILKSLMSKIFNCEMAALNASETDSNSDVRSDQSTEPPKFLLWATDAAYAYIERSVMEHQHEVVDPSSPIFSRLFGYLLAWHLLFEFYSLIPMEKRPEYVLYLREKTLLHQLLLTLFFVMPENPGKGRITDRNLNSQKPKLEMNDKFTTSLQNCFSQEPVFCAKGEPSLKTVEWLACHLYYCSLRLFPAAVRQWFNSLDKTTAANVDRYTAKYASPILSAEHLECLSQKEKQIDNLAISVRPTVGEVIAKYKTEDCTMELLVCLPAAYPLVQPKVEAKQAAVNVELSRKWLLQLTVFFAHQNGSLLDGLLLWKRNIDKHLEGMEDCMICMMTVHSVNFQLPKVTCRQCKKKFHGACLYKWFSTSSTSSCPLCRLPF